MGEWFRLEGEPTELCAQMETVGCLDEFSDADDLYRVLDELRKAGVFKCPKDLEVIVYPSAAEESDVALITVSSAVNVNAHVIAGSEEIRKLAPRELWEAGDLPALTVEIVESVIGLANGAIAAVRELEARGSGRTVAAPARCPRCDSEGQLRIEYRYSLLGLARDGSPVMAEGGELTDIFRLACGEEVSNVEGPEGPVCRLLPQTGREIIDSGV